MMGTVTLMVGSKVVGEVQADEDGEILVKQYKVWLCEACIEGLGVMCHSPGCALIRHKVDIPIEREVLEEVTGR